MKMYAGGLKKSEFILYQGEIWQIQKAEHYSPGKGSALMKVRIKNVASGKTLDYAFKSNEDVETLEVETIEMQYLYKDAENLYFMDERTYNQYTVPAGIVGDAVDFFKESNKYYVFVYNDKPLSVKPSLSVKVKVIETEDAIKGDTVSGAKKAAKIETGATIMVPLFIKQGEMIVVNPETREYVERVKE